MSIQSLKAYFFSLFLMFSTSHFANAEYGGIGAMLGGHKKGLEIISVLPGGPAEQAGLKAGDVITQVNDREISKSGLSKNLNSIKGPVGEIVHITIIEPRHQTKMRIGIVRNVIDQFKVINHDLEERVKSYEKNPK